MIEYQDLRRAKAELCFHDPREEPRVGAGFYHGLVFAIPSSALLWWGIISVVKAFV